VDLSDAIIYSQRKKLGHSGNSPMPFSRCTRVNLSVTHLILRDDSYQILRGVDRHSSSTRIITNHSLVNILSSTNWLCWKMNGSPIVAALMSLPSQWNYFSNLKNTVITCCDRSGIRRKQSIVGVPQLPSDDHISCCTQNGNTNCQVGPTSHYLWSQHQVWPARITLSAARAFTVLIII